MIECMLIRSVKPLILFTLPRVGDKPTLEARLSVVMSCLAMTDPSHEASCQLLSLLRSVLLNSRLDTRH